MRGGPDMLGPPRSRNRTPLPGFPVLRIVALTSTRVNRRTADEAASPAQDGTNGENGLRRAIVDAFAKRAKQAGIRAIVTDDLAKDLGVSKKTLYKHFRSKEEMVLALIDRWEASVERTPMPEAGADPILTMRAWTKNWETNTLQFSRSFWSDLRKDHPELYRRYRSAVFAKMRALGRLMQPQLRPGITPQFAWESYLVLMDNAGKPAFFERARMTREQSLNAALELWIQGTLVAS